MFVLETFDQEIYERDLKRDAYEEGKGAMLISSVENVMKNLNLSAEEACRTIGVTLEEYEKAKSVSE